MKPNGLTPPLFVPLAGWAFDLFQAGSKTTEFRVYGSRWNERSCPVGRPVVLSRGYGRQRRLLAWVSSFQRLQEPPDPAAWARAFGAPLQPGQEVAAIGITFSPLRPPDFVMPGPGDGTVLHAWKGTTHFDVPSDLLGAELDPIQLAYLQSVKKGGGDVPEF